MVCAFLDEGLVGTLCNVETLFQSGEISGSLYWLPDSTAQLQQRGWFSYTRVLKLFVLPDLICKNKSSNQYFTISSNTAGDPRSSAGLIDLL